MNRVITLSIALFVAMVGLALTSSEASACKLFSHFRSHCHGCQTVSHDCGGHSHGGCGHQGSYGHSHGCGHHGGGCASDCGGEAGGTVIQDQGTPKATETDVPEAPPAAEPKETSIRSNRIFRTASFRR